MDAIGMVRNQEMVEHRAAQPNALRKIVAVASIAAGVQFGWALQLSLLTPYVQLLGVPHTWAAFIWLCGPVSGMLVQPIAGYYSDHCTSRFGRRRPFIAAGALLVAVAVFLIGFAADLGHKFGDSLDKPTKPRAVGIFVLGFWILDVANNTLQGPCRAFLADISGHDHKKTRTANACFSFFMAVGNVLGYSAGSYTKLYQAFPFTRTTACDVYCANLKSCFLISITLLVILTVIAVTYVKEEPWSREEKSSEVKGTTSAACFGEICTAFKGLKKPMWMLILVTCLNWIGWFPFLLYDTDWMGKEVFGGDSKGDSYMVNLYDHGVRAGALGLMLNSIVLAVASLGVEFSARVLGNVKRLWGTVNFLLALCMWMTILVTKLAEKNRMFTFDNGVKHPLPPNSDIKAGALALFAVTGIPQAITFSIPFALASIFSSTSGAGQGLSLGVLNVAICVPQMFVSFTSGPLDAAFGGSNLPAFIMGAIAAMASGLCAFFLLPSPPPDAPKDAMLVTGGFH